MNSEKYSAIPGSSVYFDRPKDPRALYLTTGSLPSEADGTVDITDALQEAISRVKSQYNFGIVFIEEGTYKISKTIYVPKAIRLIGYGRKRPLIVLGENTPGFQTADPEDKGQAAYMFWFTNSIPRPGERIQDANAGTFYSALSNIDLRIGDGNPAAVALRTHFAQNSFISHADIHIGGGKAGIYDVGNEIEDVRFYGGDYGIYTTKPSPGWPFMMTDTYFEGQRKAAVKTREAGLTIIRMDVKSIPSVIDIDVDYNEKLYMEDCRFDGISGPAVVISKENNAHTQINLRNIACRDVPVLAEFRQSGKRAEGADGVYRVNSFTHGVQMDEPGARPVIKTTHGLEPLDTFPDPVPSDIPALPATGEWFNLSDAGAKGDGMADDTRAIRDAIEKHRVIYIPQGLYKVSDTVALKPDTVLIGLNPISTQLIIDDNTEAFGGFGPPKPLLEAPRGGRNTVFCLGLDTAACNPRAVACKWMAGAGSYMNDVKFIGGHGSMSSTQTFIPPYNETRTADANPARKWDSQYWSLWVANGGGGVFKDIWTASPYASAGLYVSDTSTAGRIYAVSVEHHVRNEVIFRNVSNWKVYALQLEEEIAESRHCQPLEIRDCSDMLFANLYMFRVIWLVNPYPYAVKTWNPKNIEFLNVHNFTQIKVTMDNTVFDVNTNTEVRPWEFARLRLSGDRAPAPAGTEVRKLAGGFEFIDGVCRDGKGNIYFADSRWKRIYQWSAETDSLRLVTDIHFKPLSLACDTEDNLLVVAEHFPPKGATIDGRPEVYPKPDDAAGTSFGHWYNTGSTVKVYAMDPDRPEESMKVIEPVPMASVQKVHKALYPANRWRDSSDYFEVTLSKPEKCYAAPDGVTVIPVCYDLLRATSLLEAFPGKPFYAVDEYGRQTVLFDVSAEGFVSRPRIFAEKGENSLALDDRGNLYIPDGQVYIFDRDGKETAEIHVPERPNCVIFGGRDGKDLYITARSSLYRVKV